jgi:hypothetical protein
MPTPKLLQNFKSENNTLEENFLTYIFCFQGLAFKRENYYTVAQNCMYFIRENSTKLRQNRK